MRVAQIIERGVILCGRCGYPYFGTTADDTPCKHVNTQVYDMSAEEAVRVQARYALGQRSNPDHDTTSYRDPPTLTN